MAFCGNAFLATFCGALHFLFVTEVIQPQLTSVSSTLSALNKAHWGDFGAVGES